MKSIFQFKKAESTTKEIAAHIIVENEIYSLVDVNGNPISEDFPSSPFAPLLCKVAKDHGLKMCGIAHMDVDFQQVVSMIEKTVEATITQIGMMANFVSETAHELFESQEESQVKDAAAITRINEHVGEAVKILDLLSVCLKAQVKKVELADRLLVEAEWDVSRTTDFETMEQREAREKRFLLEDAYYAVKIQGLDVEMVSSTLQVTEQDEEPVQVLDRLLVTYGLSEFVLIVDDLETFTLCKWYDRLPSRVAFEERDTIENIVQWCENHLESALIDYDQMCTEQDQD